VHADPGEYGAAPSKRGVPQPGSMFLKPAPPGGRLHTDPLIPEAASRATAVNSTDIAVGLRAFFKARVHGSLQNSASGLRRAAS
jgi:hypothetical protein